MRTLIATTLLLSLAACDSGSKQPATTAPQQKIMVRSPEQDALHNLDTMNRDIGLKRAIQDSGMPCKRVTKSGYVQEYNTLSMWSATCADKREWAIFVGPDGSAQVRPCEDEERLKLPPCVIAADPTGRTSRAQQGRPVQTQQQ
ncbi:hypothetical protein M8312_11475 [Sphingomonas sp. KRR8]|uniref:hypothetical protein n=1 Tax=Sphingomonas sp. KRR8 TaxID=2942996 RepID=UPI002020C691|nr:hypothetical protein [Sphingomonas sp. KRR8]URD60395.1 hypothetical protein M8312_11475 [Sphingomonas sp. KRR8]